MNLGPSLSLPSTSPPSPSPPPFPPVPQPSPLPRSDPQIQLGGLGSAVSSPVGSGAEPQPKSNFVHFSLKIRHLVATILMIFLRVLPKKFLWPHYSGPQEFGAPGSLNRLNPRFLRHCSTMCHVYSCHILLLYFHLSRFCDMHTTDESVEFAADKSSSVSVDRSTEIRRPFDCRPIEIQRWIAFENGCRSDPMVISLRKNGLALRQSSDSFLCLRLGLETWWLGLGLDPRLRPKYQPFGLTSWGSLHGHHSKTRRLASLEAWTCLIGWELKTKKEE